MLTIRQLVRRPRTEEEYDGQLRFYRSLCFGLGCTVLAALLYLGGAHG